MTTYLVIAAVLFIAAYLGIVDSRREYGNFAVLLVMAFYALRYQLGFDWVSYEQAYYQTPNVLAGWDFFDAMKATRFEAGFQFLYVALRSLDANFETLLALIAIFNVLAIDHAVRRIAPDSRAFVWAGYFCLVGLSAQMNILRQAMSSSFVLLAIVASCDKKYVRAIIFFLIAPLFHLSSVMFYPFILLVRFRPPALLTVLVLAGMVGLYFVKSNYLTEVIGISDAFIGGSVADRLDGYASTQDAGLSLGALGLMIGYLPLLRVYYRSQRDYGINAAIWLTIFVLGAHLLLAGFPSVWNRIMCVSLPWQLAALMRSGVVKRLSIDDRRMLVAAVGVVSITAFSYALTRPNTEAFKPYHSLVQVWLGDPGDGKNKALEAIYKSYTRLQ